MIRVGAGSFFFIGCLFTQISSSSRTSRSSSIAAHASRCLEACPTGAFVAERVHATLYVLVDDRVERRSLETAAHAEGWAFGCEDICNDVCPWNERFAEPTARPEYVPNEAPDRADPDYFERMSDAEFAALFGERAMPLENGRVKGDEAELESRLSPFAPRFNSPVERTHERIACPPRQLAVRLPASPESGHRRLLRARTIVISGEINQKLRRTSRELLAMAA